MYYLTKETYYIVVENGYYSSLISYFLEYSAVTVLRLTQGVHGSISTAVPIKTNNTCYFDIVGYANPKNFHIIASSTIASSTAGNYQLYAVSSILVGVYCYVYNASGTMIYSSRISTDKNTGKGICSKKMNLKKAKYYIVFEACADYQYDQVSKYHDIYKFRVKKFKNTILK